MKICGVIAEYNPFHNGHKFHIENAKKLLWNSDIPICEVAEKSGFGCQQYLNKVFKKETGMTPVSYRKAFQQNYTL